MPAEVDPDLAIELAKATSDAYAEATEELIAITSRQARQGTAHPDSWAERKLAESRRLTAQAQAVVDDLAKRTPELVDTAVRSGYSAGRGFTLGTHTRAVDALVRETTTKVAATHTQILRSVVDDYRQVITKTSALVTTGAFTIDQAKRRALADFAKKGIGGFTDAAGRRWRLDRYAEMATRTAVGRAQVAGTLDEIRSHGGDLVIVSDHSGSCKVCAPWEAKVLSISGATRGATEDGNGDQVQIGGTVADAHAGGLQHPNCRHALTRFVPGLTVPPEPQPARNDGAEERRRRNAAAEKARLDRRLKAARTGKAPAKAKTPKPSISAPPSASVTSLPRSTSKTGRAMRDALRQIDGLHTLPTGIRTVTVQSQRSAVWNGAYSSIRREVKLDPSGKTPVMTAAHEFGHYIDYEVQMQGHRISRLTDSDDPLVKAWSQSVHDSRAVAAIRAHETHPSRDIRVHTEYALRERELWARSYAQWVATRSGEVTMRNELDSVRISRIPLRASMQWTDDDFEPIASALDAIFRSRRLME